MELQMRRETDYNALLRAILLVAMTFFLARLLYTGDIKSYIHPKFIWFTATAGIGFVLMAAGQLRRAFKGVAVHPPLRSRLYIALTAVLCVGFLLRPHEFGADLAAKQGLNLTNRSGNRSVQAAAPATAPPTPAPGQQPAQPVTPPAGQPPQSDPSAGALPPAGQPEAGATQTGPAQPPLYGKAALQLVDNTAHIKADNFARWMMEIYDNHEKYAGKRVVYEGFTYHPPDAGPAEFGVLRLIVTCHVAHASPDGFLAIYPGNTRPAQDTWHRVEGVLEPIMWKGQSTVRLRVEKLTPIPKPDDPYVYG